MGPLGTPEIIVILTVLFAIPAGIAIVLVCYFATRKKPQPAQPPQIPKTPQERLLEIDALRSQNLISEAEYEEKRRHILNGI